MSSFRLLTLAGRYGVLLGGNCNNNMLRDATGVRRGDTVGLCRKDRLVWNRTSWVHALRATAATNALDHQADIAKVQEWLGHANISTTRLYTAGNTGQHFPTFKVEY